MEGFIGDILRHSRKWGVKTILPISDDTLMPLLARSTSEGEGIDVPIPSDEVFRDFSNKRKALDIAEQYGVDVPGTWRLNEVASFGESGLLALKPYRSVGTRGGRVIKRKDRLIEKEEEVTTDSSLCAEYFLQEYIRGQGSAVCFLFWHGDYVMHMEQRTEVKQEGPGSVTRAAVTEDVCSDEVEKLRKLLQEKKWHGVSSRPGNESSR